MKAYGYCLHCPVRADPLADVRGRPCVWGCPDAPAPYELTVDALRLIHLSGSPVLRRPAEPVTQLDGALEELVAALFATMRASFGIGLAAPQIGIAKRVAVVEIDGPAWTLINPEITSRSDETSVEDESCLSLPGVVGAVTRAAVVGVKTMFNGAPFGASGLAARAVQHEIDHLDGVMFTERLAGPSRRSGLEPVSAATVEVADDGRVACPGCGLRSPWGDVLDVPVRVMCHGPRAGGCRTVFTVQAQRGWRSWIK